MQECKTLRVAVFPEGPVGYDGKNYLYSKGERLYLDRLANSFDEVVLYVLAYHQTDKEFESVSHSVFKSKNLRVVEIPFNRGKYPGIIGKIKHYIGVFIMFKKELKHYDFLYLFIPSMFSAIAHYIGRIRKIPRIVYVADDWVQASESMFKWDHYRRTPIYWLFRQLNGRLETVICRSALFVVCAGSGIAEKIRRINVNSFQTIPRITLSEKDCYFREDTCSGGHPVILNVGALIHDKAQHYLLEAFSEVLVHHPACKLWIVGSGIEREALEKLASSLKISDSVKFWGFVSSEQDLYDLYKQSDMMVLSSITEGFPRVIYESMAHSVPVVCTSVGSIPSMLSDKMHALIVEPRNSTQLCDSIRSLLEQPELRQKLISNGMIKVRSVLKASNPDQICHLIQELSNESN